MHKPTELNDWEFEEFLCLNRKDLWVKWRNGEITLKTARKRTGISERREEY